MDSDELAKTIVAIVGPVVGDLVKELRIEIAQVRDQNVDEIAAKVAAAVHAFAEAKFAELDVRVRELEERWIPTKQSPWVA
jgi:hypothetical protein